ncbi:HNH endonuclease signature motif containing protein [Methylobacillus flagellatus]|uniref:HNH endonuclease signature motif containing protein n=1 Tax=Methylobacillus flagellatus TaxID=405 RepID=UPI0010F4584B|nr:HNH endonuclease signature motif containing protein [Methylobacillus flagellatus]
MPTKPPKPCKQAGCRALVYGGAYCEDHAKQRRKQVEAQRGTSTQRGYGYKWQQASKGYLKQHPLCECEQCLAGQLRLRQATVVDHKIPHRGDMTLFWDRQNWQAMNKSCHDSKTAREDGGFGL